MNAKAFKLEVLVLDFEHVTKEQVAEMLEEHRFLNVKVKKIEERPIDWSDDHPLNKAETAEEAYQTLFSDV